MIVKEADQHMFDPAGNWLGVAGEYSVLWWGNTFLAAYEATGALFNHLNGLGSSTVMTNYAGTPAEDMLFYPWGDVWQSWGTGGYNFASQPFYDTNTYTSPSMFRFYSMGLGRWLSPDPFGPDVTNPQSLNRYAYALNSPTTLTDPLGLQSCPPGTSQLGPGQCFGNALAVTYWQYGWALMTGLSAWDEFGLMQVRTVVGYQLGDYVGTVILNNGDASALVFTAQPVYGPSMLSLLGGGGASAGAATAGPTAAASAHVWAPPPTICTGVGRGLAGNTGLVGQPGGIPGQTVQLGTAAVIPDQFGGRTGAALALFAPYISGTIGDALFSSVTDVIGGTPPVMAGGLFVRPGLEYLFPGRLIIEIPGATDQGANAPVVISVPQPLGCPAGTSPL
jgi:RHS repeat-associated protein